MSDKPINRDFYEKTKAFVVSALKLLISYLQKGEQVPYIIVEKHKIEAEGVWTTTHLPQPLYFEFVDRHRKDMESLPEYDDCITAMRTNTTISKHLDCLVGTWHSRSHMTEWDYLSDFLTHQLLQLPERVEFNPETFDHIYFDWEQFFYNDSILVKAFSPLDNFNSDVDEIDLGDGLRIRRIATSELEQLLGESRWSPQIPYFEVAQLKYAMELTYKTMKVVERTLTGVIPSPDVNVNEKFGKLITALRLFKSGIVGFNIIKTLKTLDVPVINEGTSGALTYKKFLGQTYTLTRTEVSEFKSFWSKFSKIDLEQPASLSVAIRRLNYAYERDELEDKLVDFMVAFEALFFKEGERGEFRHKLSVRVARFLEQEYDQRKQIAKKMSEFYDMRSAVVHGEKVNFSVEFVNTVEDHLRRSIRLFTERLQTFTHEEIVSHLDLD